MANSANWGMESLTDLITGLESYGAESMNYIVFDLEWNQAELKKLENPNLTFEIIEIGAVKLDENGKIIGEFSQLIRPIVYPKLFYRVREVVRITEEDLKDGKGFPEVCSEFIRWCGEDYIFCSWGPMDLTELQKNMDYYGIKNPFPLPLYYYDMQKLYSICFEDGKVRRSLEYAAEQLMISENMPFHRAVNDAWYTAMIFISLDKAKIKNMVSVDYYQIPKNRREEIYLVFERYSKFVSREFPNKEDAIRDKGVASTVCYKCGHSIRRKIPWFSDSSKNYYSLSYCPVHGWMKGKIRMKRAKNGGVFAIKTLKLVNEEDARAVAERRRLLQKRRKEKRRQDGNGK